MKLESQVPSLELCKRLKELKVPQESLFWWGQRGSMGGDKVDLFHRAGYTDIESGATFYTAVDGQDDIVESQLIASAFTVAELGEMLPLEINSSKINHTPPWRCETVSLRNLKENQMCLWFACNTEADARAKMLIYLLEHHLLELPHKGEGLNG